MPYDKAFAVIESLGIFRVKRGSLLQCAVNENACFPGKCPFCQMLYRVRMPAESNSAGESPVFFRVTPQAIDASGPVGKAWLTGMSSVPDTQHPSKTIDSFRSARAPSSFGDAIGFHWHGLPRVPNAKVPDQRGFSQTRAKWH